MLQGKLGSFTPTNTSTLLFSPNGDSVIIFDGSVVHLWHTENPIIPLSDSPVDPPHRIPHFFLEFLSNGSLATVVRHGDSIVTLLDISSGAPQLTIDAGMGAMGLGMTEDTIIMIGESKATTWKLPGRSHLPGVTMNVADSTRTIPFSNSSKNTWGGFISSDFRRIAVRVSTTMWTIKDAATGGHIGVFFAKNTGVWFTPDSNNIGELTDGNEAKIWEIPPKGLVESFTTVTDIEQEQWGCPYRSSHGYRIADDGWVFGPSGQRLLILPPLWRLQSDARERKWNGQFLALLNGALPEPVLIDLEP